MQKKVLRLLSFLLLLVNSHHLWAQKSINTERCGFAPTNDLAKFEQWLKANKTRQRTTNTVYKIPVVAHVVYSNGLKEGEKENLSTATIRQLIDNLNDDFRKREGTPGYNTHPVGADARIEFQLAQQTPDGSPTNGIVRIDQSTVPPDTSGQYPSLMESVARYGYWNPEQYLNLWFYPLPKVLLGRAVFPEADLPGMTPPEKEVKADGVFINSVLFQEGENNHFNLGRTLTHEIGHFLGLFHIWGIKGGCDKDDFCEDTPPVANAHEEGCGSKPTACNGEPAMIENYMDYSYDECMNIFTQDQVARMRIVMANSPRRQTLATSPGLIRLATNQVRVYPNPAIDRITIVPNTQLQGQQVQVGMYNIQGALLSQYNGTALDTIQLKIPAGTSGIVLIKIKGIAINMVKKVLVGL
ncbi:M43 family zinc metalloprotease [uncultured Microscilla sp.]|uniref:M43 family zinc metalloprotease n=1 Tax=uncultured Microscilla sp. TaxID=432653 RepID=UPI002635AF4B|nr:M43 family zinc metalloprotease [uncultured Microscilla sp.]